MNALGSALSGALLWGSTAICMRDRTLNPRRTHRNPICQLAFRLLTATEAYLGQSYKGVKHRCWPT